MKKMMMMAMLLMASASVFAGDSDALKAILKTKTYTDAETLVKSTADQLANDQEKAKAYNQVVKLAYEAFKHEDDIAVLNATMQKNEPVNEQVKNDAAYTALLYAVECDKYDQKPNEKGKVKMAFREKNQGIVPFVRITILQAAQKPMTTSRPTNIQASSLTVSTRPSLRPTTKSTPKRTWVLLPILLLPVPTT